MRGSWLNGAPPCVDCPQDLRFTHEQAERAYDAFRFNCGPSALCAVLGLSIERFLRLPAAEEFKRKGHTNPTLMDDLLTQTGRKFGHYYGEELDFPVFGLARIQWGGPWTKPGVPMRARYRQTHWVGAWREHHKPGPMNGLWIFDVNALQWEARGLGIPGWFPGWAWAYAMVPEILTSYRRADGTWWITHSIEVQP